MYCGLLAVLLAPVAALAVAAVFLGFLLESALRPSGEEEDGEAAPPLARTDVDE